VTKQREFTGDYPALISESVRTNHKEPKVRQADRAVWSPIGARACHYRTNATDSQARREGPGNSPSRYRHPTRADSTCAQWATRVPRTPAETAAGNPVRRSGRSSGSPSTSLSFYCNRISATAPDLSPSHPC